MTYQEWKALHRLARAGQARAEFEIGMRYHHGFTTDDGMLIIHANPQRAVKWYRRAAEQQYPAAQNSLGYCLDIGEGIRKNLQEALFWYKQAWRNGDPCAASNIATLYRDQGNQRRAMFWYQRAVTISHDDDALVEVGYRYYYGIGVQRNYQAAIASYQKAVTSEMITEAGKQKAMYYLGMAYFEGKGVEPSTMTARKWFEQADRDHDHTQAQQMLKRLETM